MNRSIMISAVSVVAVVALAGGLYVRHQQQQEYAAWADDCTTIDGKMWSKAPYAKAANYTDSEAARFDSRFCVVRDYGVLERELMLNHQDTHDAAIRRRLPR